MLCVAAGLKQSVNAQTLDVTQNEGEQPVQDCLNATVYAKLELHGTLTAHGCKRSKVCFVHWHATARRLVID